MGVYLFIIREKGKVFISDNIIFAKHIPRNFVKINVFYISRPGLFRETQTEVLHQHTIAYVNRAVFADVIIVNYHQRFWRT